MRIPLLLILAIALYASDAGPSLAGNWMGIYEYDEKVDFPVGNVLMILAMNDNGVSFTGRHYELNTWGPSRKDATLECDIMGNYDAPDRVTFMHKYDGRGGVSHVLKYIGMVSDGGNTIKGTWSIGEKWTGSFVFRRIDYSAIKKN